MTYVRLKCLCSVCPKAAERMRGSAGGKRLRDREQTVRGPTTGRETTGLCSVIETFYFATPESRNFMLPQVTGNSDPEHGAQTRSEWWKTSTSFNLKLLCWSWHLHKNNAYYMVFISPSSSWLNTSSYLTEHWKLLLHHIVELSITNSQLGKYVFHVRMHKVLIAQFKTCLIWS